MPARLAQAPARGMSDSPRRHAVASRSPAARASVQAPALAHSVIGLKQLRLKWLPQRKYMLLGVFLVLLVCQAFMTLDVIADVFYLDLYIPFFDHTLMETVAVIAMGVGLVIVGRIAWEQFHENRHYRTVVETASGRLLQTIDAKFDEWKLTPSEREVALLLIKGLSVNEIATIRRARPGTVKSQCNAVYRKAGVKNRSELAAWFMEDLLSGESLVESALQERLDSRIDSAA